MASSHPGSGSIASAGTDGKGLATGTLGLASSTIIGLASTAPAYSLAATLGYVVLVVGPQAPIAFILAFIPMLFVALAYRELNNAVPDCGTSFTWGTKAFGPWMGWMAGWGVAVAGMVVLANLAQIGGKYFWLLFSDELAGNTLLVTATGVVFIALMTYISFRGMEFGEKMQVVLIVIQYAALILFAIFALHSVFTGTGPAATSSFQWNWFNPFAFTSFEGFTEAILLALFIYWGWDTCLALNEETRDPEKIPGRAALLSTVILLITYVSVTVAAMMYAGLGESGLGLGNPDNADDVFAALKGILLGPWSWLLVLAVMVSAVSSTQTTILPTARGTLSMAAYKALPRRFAFVHPRYKTPSFSTLVMGIVAIVFYVGMTVISESILEDTILSLGLAIAFYYSITSFACVWYFRRELFTSPRNFFFRFLFPLLGGVLLAAAFIKSVIDMVDPEYGETVIWNIGGVFVIGVGSLAVGVVLMIVWFMFRDSRPFFSGQSLNRDTAILVPDTPEILILDKPTNENRSERE